MDIEPRSLTKDEKAVLERLLSASFPGVEDLRKRADHIRVIGRCDCGCPTIYLEDPAGVGPDSPEHLAPVEGSVAGTEPPAEVLLFLRRDALSTLEYVYYDDEPPNAWPAASRISPLVMPR